MSDLEQFVLDYLQEVGSIVEAPAYGVYEVLLPEAVAARWRVPAYLQLAFTGTEREEVTRLGYGGADGGGSTRPFRPHPPLRQQSAPE